MSDKKNIDRLFQEKFKDFEVIPDTAVWEKIKAHQEQKRKRVILLPIWYRVAGVAALVALLWTIGANVLENEPDNDNIITDTTTQDTNTPAAEEYVIPATNVAEEITNVAEEQESTQPSPKTPNVNEVKEGGQGNYFEPIRTSEIVVRTSTGQKNATPQKQQKPIESAISENNARVVDNAVKKDDIKNRIADTAIKNEGTSDNKTVPGKEAAITSKNPENKKTLITDHDTNAATSQKEHLLFNAPPDQKNNTATHGVAENNMQPKSSEESNVVKENPENQDKVGKKSIFDVINPKEEEEVVAETATAKKWNISPNVAPVYYDALGDGSSVRGDFADNPKTGQVNLSYGVQVAYNINKKLSIRSGVNKLDLSYNTQGVGFEAPTLSRSPGSNGQNVIISDFRRERRPSSFVNQDVSSESLVPEQNPGLLNHSLGYIEVPIEISYALVNTKFGVHMIGGVSTLFLDDDDVSMISGGFEIDRIEREFNVNEVSFSGNIGLGLNYKLTQELQINLEPIFKYQFNGFKNSSKDFTPYSFGVYTGVSVKF